MTRLATTLSGLGLAAALAFAPAPAPACDAPTHAATTPTAAPAEAPYIYAVRFHADWCPACLRLAGPYADLQEQYAAADVRFVTFDLTGPRTRAEAEKMAAKLGLADLYAQYGDRTGFVLLVDPASQEVTGRLDASLSTTQMRAVLDGAAPTS